MSQDGTRMVFRIDLWALSVPKFAVLDENISGSPRFEGDKLPVVCLHLRIMFPASHVPLLSIICFFNSITALVILLRLLAERLHSFGFSFRRPAAYLFDPSLSCL